ncbi:MAG: hypothetical protein IPJ45_17655 [Ignavibacteria bacterium]|nr:hypothetical protein [Ignavibacteria bacterium]
MDTDDLSDKTYNAIMREAENFNHDLTLQFGLLSYQCKNEDEFISKSEKLIRKILKYDEEEIEEMFFGNLPSTEELHIALKIIKENIKKLKTNS